MSEPISQAVKRADSGYGSLHKTSNSEQKTSCRSSSNTTTATTTTMSSSASMASSSHRRHQHSRPHDHPKQPRQSMYRKSSPPAPAAYFFLASPTSSSSDDEHLLPLDDRKVLSTTSLSIDPISISAFTSALSPLSSEHDLSPEPSPTFMPPTMMQYWTSDRTRRAEYAAIDEANRGVKGWVVRHLLPECMVPKQSKQHVAFDDDTGSVRRYRLDLGDEKEQGQQKRRKKRGFSWAQRP